MAERRDRNRDRVLSEQLLSEFSAVREGVSMMAGEWPQLREDVDQLKRDMAELKTDGGIRWTVGDHSKRLTSLEDRVSDLEKAA